MKDKEKRKQKEEKTGFEIDGKFKCSIHYFIVLYSICGPTQLGGKTVLTQAKPVISLSPQREVVETPLGGNPFLPPPAPPPAILAVMDSVPWVADGGARGRGWRLGDDGGGGGGASVFHHNCSLLACDSLGVVLQWW